MTVLARTAPVINQRKSKHVATMMVVLLKAILGKNSDYAAVFWQNMKSLAKYFNAKCSTNRRCIWH